VRLTDRLSIGLIIRNVSYSICGPPVEFVEQHAVNKLTPRVAKEAGAEQIVFDEVHDELCQFPALILLSGACRVCSFSFYAETFPQSGLAPLPPCPR
jgi:hypothetical protein